ncbi:O-unit flippase Wzx [Geomonas silvestris]|uniref:O-unit flippase Wzx n=1 Tax=Geomonas silvestris TaxID=2740184 RepID=A0A6V8MHD0_9BACT|nr:O-unit flippase Wzx [Geomonas silvestris]
MSALFRNSLFGTVSFGLRFLSNAFLFIVIARFLGAEEFGKFALASSLAGIFLVVLDYGFNLYTVKEVAADPARTVELTGEVIATKLLLVIPSSLGLLALAAFMGYSWDLRLIIAILWAGYSLYSFGLYFNTVFRGLNLFEYEMYPTIVLNLLQIVLVSVLLFLGVETVGVALAFFAARLLYFAYSYRLLVQKVGRPKLSFHLENSKALLLKTMPFGVHAIIAVLYFQLDTVLISYYQGNSDIGHYQSAMRIVSATMVLCDVLVSSYTPLVSASFKTDGERFKEYGFSLNRYLMVVGGIVSLSLFLYADQAISLLYGPGYLQSVAVLQLLSAVIFLRFFGGAYGLLITISDNQRLRAIGVASSLFVNLALNVFLIPIWGIRGAAVACVLTHVFLNLMYLGFTYRALGCMYLERRAVASLALLGAGSVVAWQLKATSIGASLALFGVAVAVCAVCTLDDEQKTAIRKLVQTSLSRSEKPERVRQEPEAPGTGR